MKNSNNILYTLIFAVILTTFSCEDEDKANAIQSIQNAAIVTMKIENANININPDSLTSFIAMMDARPDVVDYSLQVSRVSGGQTSDTIPFNSYSSFPFVLTITRADLARTFQLNPGDIQENDRFNFIGTSTDVDGTVFTITNFTDGNGFIPQTESLEFNSIGYEFTIRVVNE